MRDYEWSKKTSLQKSTTYVLSGIYFVLFVPFFLAGAMHIHEVSWRSFWQIVHGFFILALFPLIVLPVMYAFKEKYHLDEWKHAFYREWAKVYTGYGKGGGGVNFFFEEISQFEFKRAHLKNQPFYLVTISFKPMLNYLGKGHQRTIGIGATNEEALKPLLEWAQMHGIETKLDRTDPSTGLG